MSINVILHDLHCLFPPFGRFGYLEINLFSNKLTPQSHKLRIPPFNMLHNFIIVLRLHHSHIKQSHWISWTLPPEGIVKLNMAT